MPYKASGKKVLIKKGGKWVTLKVHKTPGEAQDHAAALNAKVPHKK